MPNRELPRRVGPDRLLVLGVLALVLGLSMPTTDPLEPESAVPPGNEATALARIARDAGAAPAQLTRWCACPTIEPDPHPARPVPRPSAIAASPSASGAASDYFTNMTTLLRRRAPDGPTPDPYHASLNPTVYGVDAATPADHAGAIPFDP